MLIYYKIIRAIDGRGGPDYGCCVNECLTTSNGWRERNLTQTFPFTSPTFFCVFLHVTFCVPFCIVGDSKDKNFLG